MIGNTPRRETIIQVEANKSFVFGIQFNKPNGDALDLTGATVRLVAAQRGRTSGAEVLALEAVNDAPLQGFVQFQFQATDLAIDPAIYSYDVTMVTATGYSVPIIKGLLEVGSNTDSDVSNTYSDIHSDSEITAIIGDSNVVNVTVERIDGMYTITKGLIDEFRAEMEIKLGLAEDAADKSQYWSTTTSAEIQALKDWMVAIGFPYWKGTSDQFSALLQPDPSVLYLLID